MAPALRQQDPPHAAQPVKHAASAEPLTNGAISHAPPHSQDGETKKTGTAAATDQDAAAAASGPASSHDLTMDAQDGQEQLRVPDGESAQNTVDDNADTGVDEQQSAMHGTKRKASNAEDLPHKSARHDEPNSDGEPATASTVPALLASADQVKLLNFLFSPSSLPLARPKDEAEDLKGRPSGGARTRTYAASPFTPFEELLNALILSRPIGHMLGLRSIRTLLNPPHNLMSPKMIRDKGVEGIRQALDEARTQHRQKTAEEIVLLADAVSDTLGEDHFDVSLERVREECEHDMEREKAMLQKNIKGMGATGLAIFGRRIQGSWAEWYPFADQKTLQALETLGLPANTEKLKETLDEHWKELVVDDVIGDGEERRRRVFVRVLERAVGASLEGNLDEMKTQGLK